MRTKEMKIALEENPRRKLKEVASVNNITTADENWVDLKGFEGTHIISDKGNVRIYKRALTLSGDIIVTRNQLISKQFKKNERYLLGGYTSVRISGENKVLKRLVAESFFENPLDFRFLSHVNGDPKDCRISNLEYSTLYQLKLDNTYQQGEKSYKAKLTDEDVIDILKMYNQGYKTRHIKEKYKIHPQNLYRINKGLIWRHITAPEKRHEILKNNP